MNAPFDRQALLLTPLSPIHIGSGHDLDWTSAVLVGRTMVLFDPLRLDLPEEVLREISKANEKTTDRGENAVLRLQQIFRKYVRYLAAGKTGEIRLTEAVARKFEVAGKNTQAAQHSTTSEVDSLWIARCITNPADERPIIPGSSLKGALRTAEVAKRDAVQYPGPHNRPRFDKKDPSDLLLGGGFAKSPFARVALSDMQATRPLQSLAAQVQNERRTYKVLHGRTVSGSGIAVTAELIPPFLVGAFRGDIRIAGRRGLRDTATIPDLLTQLSTTHTYYMQQFDQLIGLLRKEERDLTSGWLENMRELLHTHDLQERIKSGRAALVRLGKYCSAESKTVAWRSVWNHEAKEYMLESRTLWLADLGATGRLPLGWALVELAETPCASVQEFCNRFNTNTPTHEEPVPELTPHIIADRGSDNGARLGMLEDGYDQGRNNDPLLERTINESKNWPEADRFQLARLVKEKARANSKLPRFKWEKLDKLLLPLPE